MTAPLRTAVADTVLLAALLVLALLGLRTTYSGDGYLVAGGSALVVGVVLGHLCVALRQPALAVSGVTVIVFFAAGPPAVLRALPDLQGARSLAGGAVHGWKDLLTTLPPVSERGPLLVIPFVLMLAGAVAGTVLAARSSSPVLPLLAPVAVLVAVLLLGTTTAPARLLQGAVFGGVALGWVVLRSWRRQATVSQRGRATRTALSVGLLALAGLAAVPLAPALPLAHAHGRVVLRQHVTPPFEIGRYPSPLASYRRYMTLDRTHPLFSVDLPAGSLVRLATLDSYDGNVWGAADSGSDPGFQRVGDEIRTTVRGTPRTVTVRVAPAWASSSNRVWLPVTGVVTGVHLPRAPAADTFRYDLATGTGVVPAGLVAGDTVVVRTLQPEPTTLHAPYGTPLVPPSQTAFLRGEVASLLKAPCATTPGGTAADPWSTVTAVEHAFLACGALSHGADAGSGSTEPGHSVHRLNAMIAQPQLVGDDEQYAALLALLANQVGVPARVVLGAVVPAGGAVQGADLHAWVELQVGDGLWHTVPSVDFVPTRAPSKQPPPRVDTQQAQPVPPPANARRPGSDVQPDLTSGDGRSRHATSRHRGFEVPRVVVTVLTYGAPPVLLVAVLCGGVLLVKSRRRRQRRQRGAPATRVAGAWAELLDHTRDLGARAPRDGTRREQAHHLEALPWAAADVRRLASGADSVIFGGRQLDDQVVQDYWTQVERFRAGSLAGLSRRSRWRARLSPASLRAPSARGLR